MNSRVWQEQEERQQLMARYEEVMKSVEFCFCIWFKNEDIVGRLGLKHCALNSLSFIVIYSSQLFMLKQYYVEHDEYAVFQLPFWFNHW